MVFLHGDRTVTKIIIHDPNVYTICCMYYFYVPFLSSSSLTWGLGLDLRAILSSPRQHTCRRLLCVPSGPFQVLWSAFLTVLISSSPTLPNRIKHKERIHTDRKTPEKSSSSFLGEHLKQLKPWSNHSFHLLRGPQHPQLVAHPVIWVGKWYTLPESCRLVCSRRQCQGQ